MFFCYKNDCKRCMGFEGPLLYQVLRKLFHIYILDARFCGCWKVWGPILKQECDHVMHGLAV